MSDSEDSTVTYTKVSSPFKDLSEIGSSGVDGLPMMPKDPYAYVEAALQAPPSPDYVLSLEYPPSPDFVLEPVYPEFMPPEDDVLPAEEQRLPAVVSPTADSPSYITKSDDEDEEEEEEHLAPSDSVPPPVCHTTARMSIRDQTPIPFPSAAEVDIFLAISTLPPSPLTSYSSPLPQIPSPPLPISSPLPVSPPLLPASHTYPLGYRAAMIRAFVAMMRVVAPSTYILASRSETPPSRTPPLLLIPLPIPSSPLLLPSTDYRAGVFESSSAPTARPTREFRRDYGFLATLDDEIRRDPERNRMTDFVTTVRQDTDEIYERLDDARDDRSLMSSQINMLRRDRRAHARTARLMESKARLSRKDWVQSMDASDTAYSKETSTAQIAVLLRTLQTQIAVLQRHQTPAWDPAHPEIPEEAGSSS
ncbi:hypothetical protein Tco_0943398 [Tanacetum coccineum]